jgi:O-succinylbenzoate synthase
VTPAVFTSKVLLADLAKAEKAVQKNRMHHIKSVVGSSRGVSLGMKQAARCNEDFVQRKFGIDLF